MAAKILTVANQKGGSGKTTIAMGIAGSLGKRGMKILVVDADQQGTATRWAAAAADDKPFPANVCGLSAAGERVHREVQKYVGSYDVIIIDCPPAVESPVPASALIIADMVLIPVIPSPPDLWAAMGIRKLVDQVQTSLNESLQARVVPNMCQPNTQVARTVLELLGQFGIEPTRTSLHLRTAHRQAAAYGCTVQDIDNATAAQDELNNLTNEVLSILGIEEVEHVEKTANG